MENEKRLIDANLIDKRLAADLESGDEKISISWFRSWIGTQETVDAVDVVNGRWLDLHSNPTQPNMFYRWWKCSECGHQYVFNEAVKRNYFASSYCPNCGAKMDGDKND